MTTDTLKARSRQFLSLIDAQKWADTREITSPACRSHIGSTDLDREGWIAQGQMFYAAFPDGKHEIDSQVAEGDVVVNRAIWRGTHRADFQGIPATGRAVAVPAIMIYKFDGDRIVEHWGIFDAVGMLQQLGAMPA